MTEDAFGLTGEICVVTGAGSGIGRSVALELAAVGAKIAILDRKAEGANETLDMVRRKGGKGIATLCDVSDEISVQRAQDAISHQFGEASVLVNCAATFRTGPLETMSLADWSRVLAVNLNGCFICSSIFGRRMLANGRGSIVHVSSLSAETVVPNMGPYSATKAAVTMLSHQIAVEWGGRGVRSNAVLPGLIRTPATEAAYVDEEAYKMRQQSIPSGRIGEPEDVARAVLFLASPLSSYVNGAALRVDGGLGMNLLNLIPKLPNRSKLAAG
jgi:glucose 1-dehydrogenase